MRGGAARIGSRCNAFTTAHRPSGAERMQHKGGIGVASWRWPFTENPLRMPTTTPFHRVDVPPPSLPVLTVTTRAQPAVELLRRHHATLLQWLDALEYAPAHAFRETLHQVCR